MPTHWSQLVVPRLSILEFLLINSHRGNDTLAIVFPSTCVLYRYRYLLSFHADAYISILLYVAFWITEIY